MSINHVTLLGHLGGDPELKQAATGKPYCTLSLATDRPPRPEGPEPEPDWHRVKVFDRQAEACARYLKKGSQLAVEGRLSHRSWRDEAGQQRFMTEVVARRVTFVGGRGPADAGGGGRRGPQPPADPAPDDIPF